MKIAERIAPYQIQIRGFQLFGHLGYKRGMGIVLLNGCHLPAPPGQKLKRNTSCSGKEIQRVQSFKIDPIRKDIKYIFLGEIGCWSRTE